RSMSYDSSLLSLRCSSSPLPGAFVDPLPLTMLYTPLILPGFCHRASIIKAQASTFNTCKIFTRKNYPHYTVCLLILYEKLPVWNKHIIACPVFHHYPPLLNHKAV